jgi:hypothetical protein
MAIAEPRIGRALGRCIETLVVEQSPHGSMATLPEVSGFGLRLGLWPSPVEDHSTIFYPSSLWGCGQREALSKGSGQAPLACPQPVISIGLSP